MTSVRKGWPRALSERLDAALILQRYSRLVIDCNRPLEAKDCVVAVSDDTAVPANADIADLDRRRRYVEIHQPLHEAIAVALGQRQATGKPLFLVSVHSFTPVMRATGAVRTFELGPALQPRCAPRRGAGGDVPRRQSGCQRAG
jgi:predicted N-formylglutamate amidohydrolase